MINRHIKINLFLSLLMVMFSTIVSKGQDEKMKKAENNADSSGQIIDTLLNLSPDGSQKYPLLYHEASDSNLVESIGYLKGDKLLSTPSTFLNNALTGRVAGLYTNQSSGEPGNDGVSLSLRGGSPLVLIDGVPRALWSINPEQIKSVTVLKDALSTAMLGMQGMNGAILITTKKGKNIPGFNMDIKAQTGVSTPIQLPQPLSAYQYAMLYNEALANDGQPPLYTTADLDAYKNHTDPYGHPDINWYDQLLKKSAPFSRYTLDAQGANKAVRYFVSLDYLDQGGLFKQSPINSYSTNTDYKRYTFRSNVEAKIAPDFSMFLNLFGRMRSQNEPGGGTDNIFSTLLATANNAYPIFNPDGSLGGNINFNNNIYGQSVLSGYTSTTYSEGYADLGFKYDLNKLLKGLWLKGTLSYVLTLNQNINRSKNFETYQMLVDPAMMDTAYQKYGSKSDQSNASNVTTRAHQFYDEISAGYAHHWNGSAISAMLMYNTQSNTSNSDLPNAYRTLATNVQYSIQDKYILQAAASYSGNNRYQPGYLYGFFPAAGIAWRIDKENFFHKGGFINALKLRATYGLTGDAVGGYYDYIDRYVGSTGYYFGTSAGSVGGLSDRVAPYVNTWAKGLKLDVGMDMHVAQNRGSLTLDYYRNNLSDLTQPRGQSSGLLGYGNSITENLGKNLYAGLEISAGWKDQVGAFGYNIQGNFSVSNSKIIYNDEPQYPYSWMQHTGDRVDAVYGYVADGFIAKAGAGPVVEGYSAVPGDIKYKDLNGDGVINQFDQKIIGNQKPLLFYGVDFGFTWKHFALSFLIQGVANEDLLHTGNAQWAFQNNGAGQAWQNNLNRWTPATAATATAPRLSVGNNVNNDVNSSFWLKSGDFLRLKNAEFSYSFDKINLKNIKIHQLKIFVNGLNLLTFAKYKGTDPEVLLGSYPIEKVVNGGIKIAF